MWGRLLNYQADKDYVAQDNPSLARTPLVIAMWEPLARALGWPKKPVGWGEVPFLAVPDHKDDVHQDRYRGEWGGTGYRQTEARQAWPRDYYLWAWLNPRPEQPLAVKKDAGSDRSKSTASSRMPAGLRRSSSLAAVALYADATAVDDGRSRRDLQSASRLSRPANEDTDCSELDRGYGTEYRCHPRILAR